MNWFLQAGPCGHAENVLGIINAIFNGCQMLLLTWMGNRMGRMSHTQDLTLEHELKRTRKD